VVCFRRQCAAAITGSRSISNERRALRPWRWQVRARAFVPRAPAANARNDSRPHHPPRRNVGPGWTSIFCAVDDPAGNREIGASSVRTIDMTNSEKTRRTGPRDRREARCRQYRRDPYGSPQVPAWHPRRTVPHPSDADARPATDAPPARGPRSRGACRRPRLWTSPPELAGPAPQQALERKAVANAPAPGPTGPASRRARMPWYAAQLTGTSPPADRGAERRHDQSAPPPPLRWIAWFPPRGLPDHGLRVPRVQCYPERRGTAGRARPVPRKPVSEREIPVRHP
jgi:hypothetical protein